MERNYTQEMQRYKAVIQKLVELDDIDVLYNYSSKLLNLQQFLIDNHDSLSQDEYYIKTYSDVVNHLIFIANTIENMVKKKYSKNSVDYKKNMYLAYDVANKTNMIYLATNVKYHLTHIVARIRCEALDLYDKTLNLEIEAPDQIECGKPFAVTYINNQEGEHFSVQQSNNISVLSGPYHTISYSPTFVAKHTYTFIIYQSGSIMLPIAQIEIDGQLVMFPPKQIYVKSAKPTIMTSTINTKQYTEHNSVIKAINNTFQPSEPQDLSTTKPNVEEVSFDEVKSKQSVYEKYLRLPYIVRCLIKIPVLLLTIILGALLFIKSDKSIGNFAFFSWMFCNFITVIWIFFDKGKRLNAFAWAFIPAIIVISIALAMLPSARIIKDQATYSKKTYMTTTLNVSGHTYELQTGEHHIINLTGRNLYISDIGYGSQMYAPRNVVTISNGQMIKDPGVSHFFKEPPRSVRTKSRGFISKYLDYKSY